jgi:hypothetical protein
LCYDGRCASMELWRPTSRHAVLGRERHEDRRMTRKRVDRENTGWRISVEAKRLLERMAERSAISQTEVLEEAIREKAYREQVTLEADAANGTPGQPAAPTLTPEESAAVERLRQLAQKVRAGEDVPPEEIRREMDLLRAGIPIIPAKRSGPPDPEWEERFQRLLDEVRAGVPEEWTEEELQERVKQAVTEVRARRRASGEWPPAVPTFVSPQQKAFLEAFQDLAESTRARFAKMTPEEIDREVERAIAYARESRRARRH